MDTLRKPAPLLALTVLLGASYYWLLIELQNCSWIWSPQPQWWRDAMEDRTLRAILWTQWRHTFGVIAAALPIGAALSWLAASRRTALGLVVGIGVAIAALTPSLLGPVRDIFLQNLSFSTVFDFAKIVVAVPIWAWAFRGMPSNNSLDGTRGG